MRRLSQPLLVALAVVILVVGVLAVWLVGAWALVVPSVLILFMVIGAVVGAEGVSERLAWLLAGLGGVVGAASAASALLDVGGQPVYAGRAIFGWVALVLSVLAALSILLVRSHLIPVVLCMLSFSTLGFLLMNLFYINSWYFAGMLLFWCAAVAALTARPSGEF